jgi:hypothetical protein
MPGARGTAPILAVQVEGDQKLEGLVVGFVETSG